MDVPRARRPNATPRALRGVVIFLLVLATVAVSRFRPGLPSVDPAALNLDTVRQGAFVREVRAAGALIPETVLFISALSAGRIDHLHVRPGERVKAGRVLLEMTNPDVRLEVLEAERQLAAAQAVLVTLKASLETQRLNQASIVASVRTQQREAERQANAKSELMRLQVIAPLEAAHSRDQADELNERLKIETDRLQITTRAITAQLQVQEAEIARLRAIVEFQRDRHDALTVRATADAVVQEIPSETGQWVNPGQTLVRMHSGERLKAVLRVPQLEAKDVSPGQAVVIDTRNGIVRGHVIRVSPAVQGGVVPVEVALPDSLPRGARPDLSVDGTIEVERVANALHVTRTPDARAFAPATLYRIDAKRAEARRVAIEVGRTSSTAMEIVRGLAAGDVVIVSTLDVSAERIRLKN